MKFLFKFHQLGIQSRNSKRLWEFDAAMNWIFIKLQSSFRCEIIPDLWISNLKNVILQWMNGIPLRGRCDIRSPEKSLTVFTSNLKWNYSPQFYLKLFWNKIRKQLNWSANTMRRLIESDYPIDCCWLVAVDLASVFPTGPMPYYNGHLIRNWKSSVHRN